MALPLANTAEGGSNGTGVTLGNSGGASGDAFTNVLQNTGTITYSSTQKAHGALSYAFAQPASITAMHVDWDSTVTTAGASWSGRLYWWMPVNMVTGFDFIRLFNGATLAGGIGLNTAGTLQIHSGTGGNTAVGTASTTAADTNAWNRIEWTFTAGTGTAASAAAWLWKGASLESAADPGASNKATWSGGASNTVTTLNQIQSGNFAGPVASTTTYVDSMTVVSGTTMPGPLVAAEVMPALVMPPQLATF